MKHNKKHNIGIIFELLTRQVAEGVVRKRPEASQAASDLIYKYFSLNTVLHEELSLFNILLYNQTDSHSIAGKLLESVLAYANGINETELCKSKDSLLEEIRNTFREQDFFKIKISNYKVYASIQQLLDNSRQEKKIKNITEKIVLEEAVIDHLLNNTEVKRVQEYKAKVSHKPVDNFTMKLIFEKFNEKYGSTFNKHQKSLLKTFINDDTPQFKSCVESEVKRVDATLREAIDKCEDSILKIKLQDAKKILNEVESSEPTEQLLAQLLTYLDLAKELGEGQELVNS